MAKIEKKACPIEGCGNTQQRGGKCRKHHLEEVHELWLDNSDLSDPTKGIFGFANACLRNVADNNFAKHHIKMAQEFLQLYSPDKRNYLERMLANIVFREGAKSSFMITILISYLIAFNGKKFKLKVKGEIREYVINENFIVIMSETGDVAENFTVGIRDNFSNNQWLRWYFPYQIAQVYLEQTKQWTKKAFRINGVFVLARGWDQQIRGIIRDSGRPSFLIADDIYSEKNISDVLRPKIRAKWSAAVKNSMDTKKGKIVWNCTLIHEDTVSVDLITHPLWRVIEYPVMPYDLFMEFAETHIDTMNGVCLLPFDDIDDDEDKRREQKKYFDNIQTEKDWKLSWPERRDLFFIALKYQEAHHDNTVAQFFQEFFHIIVPDELKLFKPNYFRHLEDWKLTQAYGYNWFHCKELYGDIPQVIKLYLGVDTAGMRKYLTQSDDTVLTLTGILPDHTIIVFFQLIGRMNIRDDLMTNAPKRLDRVVVERKYIKNMGWADEIFRWYLRYGVKEISIGSGGNENKNIPEVERIFKMNGVYGVNITERKQTAEEGSKIVRITETLLDLYQTGMVWHANPLVKLQKQLEHLGRSKKDDAADSLECAVWPMNPPQIVEISHYDRNVTEDKFNQTKKPAYDWFSEN